MKAIYREYNVNDVICREGDPSTDLYLLRSGKLLICTLQGTQVKALATIEEGEFIGELSFFDGQPRSSHIIALEKSTLFQIPKHEMADLLPEWYLHLGINLTKKIRVLDHVVQESNLRRASEKQKQLSIEEQRLYYKAITQQNA